MAYGGTASAIRYSKNTPEFFVSTGFNKWGMTSSMVAADLLTDMVLGREKRYAKIFDPSRTILRPQLAVNALETVLNLATPTADRPCHTWFDFCLPMR